MGTVGIMTTGTLNRSVGELLREWRGRRRLSQLELATAAEVSTRHLSFVETGRSKPSREMILRLAEELDVPLRERNHLLMSAGFAPIYQERTIDAPEMGPARIALNKVLDGHEPYPALVVDRSADLVLANNAAMIFLDGVDPELTRPPVNLNRLALHPRGLAARIENLPEVRAHLLQRLARHAALTGDPALAAQHAEVAAYGPYEEVPAEPTHEIVLPIRLRAGDRVLSFFSTIATFGTAMDVTLSELSIESFYPADEATAEVLRERAAADAG